ncbi:MAG TPA: tRNA preQ1(34) S-adenosylmethionine ribosyltransferase-isomerase QueA [Stellaceae bacterium]|jgi:S-adenosylmethionine:tRNA ribosyltransferase-isomerase|nr:tRNA preQ1(34) S-adenosylmethionine ribosyltransferase-isomerase QueA [Stellaceae bacterium]
MHLADFAYDLPRDLIADRPAEPRESARLLVLSASGGVTDRHIGDLPALLQPGDLLVFNDTRVIPARLIGRRGQATIKITLARDLGGGIWRAYAKGARRLRSGDRLDFAEDFAAEIVDKTPDGEVTLRFSQEGDDFRAALTRYGIMPLPPYIKRPRGGEARDRTDYQTMFARNDGAVAAPTAGLHFTPDLLASCAARGIEQALVTLHVGPGTFLPVKVDDPREHHMHAEWGQIDAATADRINTTRDRGGRVVAVGTTSVRLLESAAAATGRVAEFCDETRLFILPGYRFRAIDLLLTNFHLPRSTLLMLVAALAGLDRIKSAYAHAVARRYRFFSYGDACLIEPADGAIAARPSPSGNRWNEVEP